MTLLRTISLIAALAAPLPLYAAAANTQTTQPAVSKAEQLFAEGRDAMFRRDYPRAIELLRSAVALDKSKTSYRLYLARALQYSGDGKAAEALLADIIKANPDHVEAGQLLGEIYAAREDWKKVVELMEPLLKYRHDYQIYHLLAEAKYTLNDMEKARKYYEEAIKLNPASASDHYQLGNIYLSNNSFELAVQSYQNAVRLGLKSAVLHYKLGSAYFNLRNYFGGIANVAVRAGRPGTISGDWYLIEAVPGKKELFRAAPHTSAIYQITKAMEEGLVDRPDIQFLRANIYLNAGRYQTAYDLYGQMRNTVSKEDKALFFYYFAQAAFGVGKFEEYLDLLNEAIKLNKDAYQATLVDAYLKVADQYNQAGELNKYIDYLVKAVNESPQAASLHLRLGSAYEEANKLGDAAVQWQMVLDLEPDHPRRLELLNLIKKARTRPPTTAPAK
jgi:tetratricopeptide (TPR) repeat protein